MVVPFGFLTISIHKLQLFYPLQSKLLQISSSYLFQICCVHEYYVISNELSLVLGIKLRALGMLDKCAATELNS
jgi:hypothetical protein